VLTMPVNDGAFMSKLYMKREASRKKHT